MCLFSDVCFFAGMYQFVLIKSYSEGYAVSKMRNCVAVKALSR